MSDTVGFKAGSDIAEIRLEGDDELGEPRAWTGTPFLSEESGSE